MPTVDIERYVDATAEALALPIAPEHRPGVLRYFELVAAIAAQVTTFELTEADESGNVFRPLEPRS